MVEWVTNLVRAGGYWGIALLMFLENVFPPIPSEVIMPLGGFVAGRGELSFWGVVLAGTVGSVLGQLPLYYLGYAVGEDWVKRLADKYGKWLTVSGDDVGKAVGWFDRHGGKAVLLCRFVPGVRTLISLPAGIQRMNLAKFLAYSAVGMGAWAAVLAYLGRLLGANYARVSDYVGPAGYVVFGLIAVALVGWVIYRKVNNPKVDDD